MFIKLIIDRFEGIFAVLITVDGQEILWPKNKLPQDAHAGMALNFTILNDQEFEVEQKKTAKNILNEILNTED